MKISLLSLFLVSLLAVNLAQAQQLSSAELEDLQYVREEEKLARDVYQYLFSQWGLQIFDNIAVSEQRHMDAMLTLLNLYGITDPVGDNGAGIFTDQSLQDLYNQLTNQGGASVIAALEVGVFIEETDITDLEAALVTTDESAIIRVYSNLLKGSNNHLAAFINVLESQGGSYSGGNQTGSSQSPGTSVYDPVSQTLYIPALDVDFGSGDIVVYDALLRLIETLPQALQAVSATVTDKQPNPDLHASFDAQTGVLIINDLVVGALTIDGLNDSHFSMVLQMDMSNVDAALFTVENIILK